MNCKKCESSNTVKIGKRNSIQRYMCKDCGFKFLDNGNFERMRSKKQIISVAIDLYFDGMSVRKIKNQIQYIFKVRVSQVTIHEWITKYSELIREYTNSIKLELGDEWHIDETVIKVNGEQKWFWEIIDKDTRVMVASLLSDSRTIEDCTKLFEQAKNIATKKPKVIYADGCFSYRAAFNKVFYDHHQSCKLIQNVGIRGRKDKVNQNLIERLHGTVKDMLMSRRGMDEELKTGTMLKGWSVHYNFLRTHSTIGKTPVEATGLKLDLSNRWESLIDMATKWKANKAAVNAN